MISFEKALETVMGACSLCGTEEVDFKNTAGRILAVDVTSDTDLPPFNRSAVDGYACHHQDLGKELEITEIIPAGKMPLMRTERGKCAKVMTGAIVPPGYDFVFMVEDATVTPSGKVIFSGGSPKPNISLKGEDVKSGEMVIRAGKLIKPQDIAVLASVGHIRVTVSRKPVVAVISTGDELVEPPVKPQEAQIRNSNAFQLAAQAERTGASVKYYGIAPDDEEVTFRIIGSAISGSDVILLTGGVSMGDYDFVPAVLQRAGVKILFDRVNVQPGKPTTFGVHGSKLIFGLPGNPVSAFIQFETLVRPALYRMMGYDWEPLLTPMPLSADFARKSVERMAWVPVRITDEFMAQPVEYHGSAHITAFPYADGVFSLPPGKERISRGEIVVVRHI